MSVYVGHKEVNLAKERSLSSHFGRTVDSGSFPFVLYRSLTSAFFSHS